MEGDVTNTLVSSQSWQIRHVFLSARIPAWVTGLAWRTYSYISSLAGMSPVLHNRPQLRSHDLPPRDISGGSSFGRPTRNLISLRLHNLHFQLLRRRPTALFPVLHLLVPSLQRQNVGRGRMLDGNRLPRFARRRQGCRAPFAARVSLTVAVAGPYVYPQARHCRKGSREGYGGEFSSSRNAAHVNKHVGNKVKVNETGEVNIGNRLTYAYKAGLTDRMISVVRDSRTEYTRRATPATVVLYKDKRKWKSALGRIAEASSQEAWAKNRNHGKLVLQRHVQPEHQDRRKRPD